MCGAELKALPEGVQRVAAVLQAAGHPHGPQMLDDAARTAQQAADEAEAMQDAAQFARRVRRRLGLSQAELASRIQVSLDTIRNWEQGKRSPTGAAKALLKVLDKAPEAALAALY